MNTRLADRIRSCRYAKGLGPEELAEIAEISRTALYQIEAGKTETPRAATLLRIARALDVSVEELLGRSGLETPISTDVGPRSVASAGSRDWDLRQKLQDLLASPLGDGVARIVEEAHAMLLRNRTPRMSR